MGSDAAARRAGRAFRARRGSFDPAIGRGRKAAEFQHGGTSCGEPTGRDRRPCALTLGHSGGHRA